MMRVVDRPLGKAQVSPDSEVSLAGQNGSGGDVVGRAVVSKGVAAQMRLRK